MMNVWLRSPLSPACDVAIYVNGRVGMEEISNLRALLDLAQRIIERDTTRIKMTTHTTTPPQGPPASERF